MGISEAQKKIRNWLRRHGWSTGQPPTNQGVWLSTPVQRCSGSTDFDTKTGRYYTEERMMDIEIDRFSCDYVRFKLSKRKNFHKRDTSVPNNCFWYSHVPTDEFSDWETCGYMAIPSADMIKLAELIVEAKKDWVKVRPSKRHLTFMEHIANSCGPYWLGVNTTYDEEKWTYSNERLKQERNCTDPFTWEP